MLILWRPLLSDKRVVHVQSDPAASLGRKKLAALSAFTMLLTLSACGGVSAESAPELIGKRLDIAKSDLEGLGVDEENIQVVGGGTFGALDESNWIVCDQEPEAGEELSDTPRLLIDRTCATEDTFEAVSSPEPTLSQPAIGDEATSPTPSPVGPPPEVAVDTCEKVGIEVVASGTVRNVDTQRRTFAITVEFYDNGGAKIEEGTDFLSVDPDQTARWRQDNYTEEAYTLGDCRVVSVN